MASAPRRNAVLERAPLQNPKDLLSGRGERPGLPKASLRAGLLRPRRQGPAGAPVGGSGALFAPPRRKSFASLKVRQAAKAISQAAAGPAWSNATRGKARLTKRAVGKTPGQKAHLVPKKVATSGDANAQTEAGPSNAPALQRRRIGGAAAVAMNRRRQKRVPVILRPAAPKKEELFQNESTRADSDTAYDMLVASNNSQCADERPPLDRRRQTDNRSERFRGGATYDTPVDGSNSHRADQRPPLARHNQTDNPSERFQEGLWREPWSDKEHRPREDRYADHEGRRDEKWREQGSDKEYRSRGDGYASPESRRSELWREQGSTKEHRSREDRYASQQGSDKERSTRDGKYARHESRRNEGWREQGSDKEYPSREDKYAIDESRRSEERREQGSNKEYRSREDKYASQQGSDKERSTRDDKYARHESRRSEEWREQGSDKEHRTRENIYAIDESRRSEEWRKRGSGKEYRSREDRYASQQGSDKEHRPREDRNASQESRRSEEWLKRESANEYLSKEDRYASLQASNKSRRSEERREQELDNEHCSREDPYASPDSRRSEERHFSKDGVPEEALFSQGRHLREEDHPGEERPQRLGSARREQHSSRNKNGMHLQDEPSRDMRLLKEEERSEEECSEYSQPVLEASLEEMPLTFAGLSGPLSLALGSAGWENVLHDEPRRSFVSLKRRAFRTETLEQWFLQLRTHLQWRRVRGAQLLPRSGIWLTTGSCACPYRHSGKTWPATAMEPWFLEITDSVRRACGIREMPNSCSGTLYEGGGEGLDWQADDDPLFDATRRDTLIVSLSLGAARHFELSPQDTPGRAVRLLLQDGDLCSMEGRLQTHYKHRVPRELEVERDCINLTWRWIVTHEAGCREAGRAGVRRSRVATAAVCPNDQDANDTSREKRHRRAQRFGSGD